MDEQAPRSRLRRSRNLSLGLAKWRPEVQNIASGHVRGGARAALIWVAHGALPSRH
jgi:hypothetical protein